MLKRAHSASVMSSFYSELIAPSGAFKTFKDGSWVESSSGNTVAILNPTSNKKEFYVQGSAHAIAFIIESPCDTCTLKLFSSPLLSNHLFNKYSYIYRSVHSSRG